MSDIVGHRLRFQWADWYTPWLRYSAVGLPTVESAAAVHWGCLCSYRDHVLLPCRCGAVTGYRKPHGRWLVSVAATGGLPQVGCQRGLPTWAVKLAFEDGL